MINGSKDQSSCDLSTRIRTARKKAYLSQQALGKGIGLSDKSISAYEQRRSAPPFSKLKRIAQVTQQPLSYFTNTVTDNEAIDSIILSIERDLQEIKNLLKKS